MGGKPRIRASLVALAIALAASLMPLVATAGAHDGHSHLWGQGLLPGETGLTAPLGDASARSAGTTSIAAADGARGLRVYVVVVDGLRPQEIGPLTPNIDRLRQDGTWYEQARSVLPAETLPNHAAMMTGVRPQRNGIVANQIYRTGNATAKEYMQYPAFLEADTLTTRLERAFGGDISTATVLSKEYLYGVFLGEHEGSGDPLPQREADFHWDPRTAFPFYVDDPSDHALDTATMDAFMGWLGQEPALPHFGFVNLGNVDRAGHADESGVLFAGEAEEGFPDQLTAADISPFRQGAIEEADVQVGRLISHLEEIGAWGESVVILLSDHGMDWGFQHRYMGTVEALTGAGYALGTNPPADAHLVGGGGSELVYVHHKSDIAPMAKLLSEVEGVEFVATRERVPGLDAPTLAELGIDHRYSPDIEIFAETGYRSSPDESGGSNPLPGNHGHSVTQHSALLVGGGHPALRNESTTVGGDTVFDRERERLFVDPAAGPGVMSIAPTVAALFGIGEPAGGFDGDPLTAAFDPELFPTGSGGGTTPPGDGGTDPSPTASAITLSTTLAPSRRRVGYRERLTISGQVSAPARCEGALRVSLHRQDAGVRRATLLADSLPVRGDGGWSQVVRPSTTATYFARVQPTPSCEGSVSPAVRVPVRAQVKVARSCGAGRRVSGQVKPAAPRTRVHLERRARKGYARVASTKLDRGSRFRLTLPSCAGRYRVVWPSQGGRNTTGTAAFTARRGGTR